MTPAEPLAEGFGEGGAGKSGGEGSEKIDDGFFTSLAQSVNPLCPLGLECTSRDFVLTRPHVTALSFT